MTDVSPRLLRSSARMSYDPEVDLNVVTEDAHRLQPGYSPAGLVNAFGFGGHSVALVITGA